MPDSLHVRLGKVIAREYPEVNPTFFSDPGAIKVDDLGFEILHSIWQTDLGGDPVACGLLLRDTTGASPGPVVVGCGTRTEIEWVEDALAFLDQVAWAPNGVKAHRWFLSLCNSLRTETGVDLATALEGSYATVAGHSLWAAVATLFAAKIKASVLVAFASPRTWNQAGADWAQAQINDKTVYVNMGPSKRDLVTDVPPEWLEPFRHMDGSIVRLTCDPAQATWSGLHDINTYIAAILAFEVGGSTPAPS